MDINSLLTMGGPVVYILILLSIYATAVILYKLHVFYKVNFFKADKIGNSINLWISKNHTEAYESINNIDHPETDVISFTMYQLTIMFLIRTSFEF